MHILVKSGWIFVKHRTICVEWAGDHFGLGAFRQWKCFIFLRICNYAWGSHVTVAMHQPAYLEVVCLSVSAVKYENQKTSKK